MTRELGTAPRPEHVLARSMRAGRDWLLAAIRRYPLLSDAALAAAVLAISLPQVITPTGVDVPSLALIGAEAVLLVFRRQEPFGVFWLIFILNVVQLDVTSQGIGNALLVAFYTVAAYEPPRRVLLAAVTLAAGVTALVAFAPAGIKDSARVWGGPERVRPVGGGRVRRLLRPHPACLPRGPGGPGRAAGAGAGPAGAARRGGRTGQDRA